jgi:hypothetical protein
MSGMDGTQRGSTSFYRPAQVAERLQCSEWWVKEQARRRRIPFCWIGGGYLFTEEHIVAILQRFEVQAVDGEASVSAMPPPRPRLPAQSADAPATLRARPPRRARSSSVAA